jgi:hypothetical protein
MDRTDAWTARSGSPFAVIQIDSVALPDEPCRDDDMSHRWSAVTGGALPRANESEAARQFTDAEGLRWTVVEERIPSDDWTSADEENHRAGYGVGWLHFCCAALRRRLRLFPAIWQTLSDADLDRLCRRALRTRPA